MTKEAPATRLIWSLFVARGCIVGVSTGLYDLKYYLNWVALGFDLSHHSRDVKEKSYTYIIY